MSAAVLHSMLESPDLPELIEQAQHALANELNRHPCHF
jgi:hypothetical protein